MPHVTLTRHLQRFFPTLNQTEEVPGAMLTSRKTDTTLSEESWWTASTPVPHNDLMGAALALEPDLGRIAAVAVRTFPDGTWGMTGSGPTLFGFLADGNGALERARAALPHVGAWLTRTIDAAEYRTSRFVPRG